MCSLSFCRSSSGLCRFYLVFVGLPQALQVFLRFVPGFPLVFVGSLEVFIGFPQVFVGETYKKPEENQYKPLENVQKPKENLAQSPATTYRPGQ